MREIPARTDHRYGNAEARMREGSLTEGLSETLSDAGDAIAESMHDMRDRAETLAGDVATAVRNNPYTALACAGGVAFAIGALWMLSRQRPQSRLDALMAHMPDLPSRNSIVRNLRRHFDY